MKKGFHSTQDKVFKSIPRSEFLGIALGYAGGLIVSGLLPALSATTLEVVGCCAGFALGWLCDRKYYLEPDVPEEELAQPETEAPPADI